MAAMSDDSQSGNASRFYNIIQAHDKIFYESFPFKSYKFNRLLVLSTLQEYIDSGVSVKKPIQCCDVVSDCGGNGLLWKLVFGSTVDVVVNNCETQISELIQRNASLNNLKVTVANKDACVLLHERGYNFVAYCFAIKLLVHPVYGAKGGDGVESSEFYRLPQCQPVLLDSITVKNGGKERSHFLRVYLDCKTEAALCFDAVLRNISRQGIIVITTNDDSSFHGGDNNVALRRYGGKITRTTYAAELGIRLFLGSLARAAARHDRAIRVLYGVVHKSTFTVAVMCLNGASNATRAISEELRCLKHCMNCEERLFYPHYNEFPPDHSKIKLSCECFENAPGETSQVLGPLYSGDIFDANFIERILSRGLVGEELETKLKIVSEEARCPSKEADDQGVKRIKLDHSSTPPFYYNIHKHHPRSEQQVAINKIIKELHNNGYRASRTHFDRVSIRTSANSRQLSDTIKSIKTKS